MGLIKVLGLDWKVLLAQFINFAVLLFVLFKFAYKPMFKFLDDRKDKIEKGIENAARAEDRLKEITEKELEVLKKAKVEAVEILNKAQLEAEEIRKRELTKTREEIGKIINQEKENMRQEKAEVLRDIKSEVSKLVISSVEKVLEEKIDSKKDEEIIKKMIKDR
ncbi:MAG: F0F1 ATP synthase subunit B [Patescibacteria group bacterium]|jgi:F-type H+-transporting ATPase subunit b